MFTYGLFKTDVVTVSNVDFIYPNFFESQGNFGVGVRVLLTLFPVILYLMHF